MESVVHYAMPDMTGAEMLSRARQAVGGIPAILRKPFDIAALGDALSGVLEHARERVGA